MGIVAKVAIGLAFVGIAATSAQAQNDKIKALAAENNAFALDLYKQNFKADKNIDKNIFLSPYSISSALAMTYGGAVGATADEMQKTLHWSLGNTPEFHHAFGELQKSIDKTSSEKLITRVANRLWPDRNTAVVEAFAKSSRENYGAEIEKVDFADGKKAAATINAWVESKTNNLIKNLLDAGDVQGASMVLVNAIYFYGEWAIAFDKDFTQKRSFTTTANTQKDIDFMHLHEWRAKDKNTFRYTEDKKVQVLELPYEDNKASMLIILPKNAQALNDIVENINPEQLKKWTSQLAPPKLPLNIALPKWKIEYQFSVKNSLQDLGMLTPFSELANFSKMLGGRVRISDVIHKAFVEVSEKGTEAAAATAVIMVTDCATSVVTTINFIANHPFLYLIRDNATGSILFMGQLSN